MRYNGNPSNSREYRMVKLPRKNGDAIELRVSALPIGIDRIYNQIIKRPTPPVIVAGAGKERTKEANYSDPAFEAAWEEYSDLRNFFCIWLAIKDSPNLEFESCKPDAEMTADKLRAFYAEVQKSNLTAGDILIITHASQEAGNMNDEAIKDAEKSF